MKSTRWTRRDFLFAAGASFALTVGGHGQAIANTADWPAKPIKLMVPWPAGGPTDVTSRVIGKHLSERLKQAVVIENNLGASGAIGTQQVARSAPDGYTLTMMATPTLLAKFLYKSQQVDVTKDLQPVAVAYDLPLVLVVNPQVLPNVKTLQNLLDHIRAQNGEFLYTTSTPGSIGHVGMVQLLERAGLQAQHIGYKGGPAAMTDLLGGHVGMMFGDLVVALPHIKSGRLLALGVGSSAQIEQLPEVQTIAEQGFAGFEASAWAGLLAPKGTPMPVVERLSQEIEEILKDEGVRRLLVEAGTMPVYKNAAEMSERLKADAQRWGTIIKEKNITP